MSLTIRRRNSGCAWLVVKFALTGFISASLPAPGHFIWRLSVCCESHKSWCLNPLELAYTSLISVALLFIITDYLFIFARLIFLKNSFSWLPKILTSAFSSSSGETETIIWTLRVISSVTSWKTAVFLSVLYLPFCVRTCILPLFKASSPQCAHCPVFIYLSPVSPSPMSANICALVFSTLLFFPPWLCYCPRVLKLLTSLRWSLFNFLKDQLILKWLCVRHCLHCFTYINSLTPH